MAAAAARTGRVAEREAAAVAALTWATGGAVEEEVMNTTGSAEDEEALEASTGDALCCWTRCSARRAWQ